MSALSACFSFLFFFAGTNHGPESERRERNPHPPVSKHSLRQESCHAALQHWHASCYKQTPCQCKRRASLPRNLPTPARHAFCLVQYAKGLLPRAVLHCLGWSRSGIVNNAGAAYGTHPTATNKSTLAAGAYAARLIHYEMYVSPLVTHNVGTPARAERANAGAAPAE